MTTDRSEAGAFAKCELSRREFLRRSVTIGAGAALASTGLVPGPLNARELDSYQPAIDLAVAKGSSPSRNCLAAVEALGGFGKFVKNGDKVVVKPNPIGGNPPDRAVNTHPDMVESVIRECLRAGAREVVALSHDDARSFTENGTATAIERAGGKLTVANDRDQYRQILVPRGRILEHVEIAAEVLDADVFINMPIAKHHAGSRLTLTMKNLMGINWNRIVFHQTDLHQCIAELATTVKHHLVILDANHVLLNNGPGGPGDVLKAGHVVAGVDPVAVDAFATSYFDLEPAMIDHIRIAYELGVGEMDLDRLKIEEFAA
jgi:uncharacterized protein (DUF362 family)